MNLQGIKSFDLEVLDPDNIRKRIADEDKAEKIIALTNDAVVFYNVRNSLSEMDTPALMAIADRFVCDFFESIAGRIVIFRTQCSVN